MSAATEIHSGRSPSVLVVGVGASAGGLEALEKLFSQIPAESGIAFIVIQHLDPRHKSMLPELLGRHTRMPVLEAQQGLRVEADRVYTIAPGTHPGLSRGAFVVGADGRHDEIDTFFQALAADQGERAAGIILSGSGSDGTSGLRAIKEHGGFTLAQVPESATHDSMPRSVIEAGLVDHVLLVEQMPAKLLERARELAGRQAGGIAEEQLSAETPRICEILQRTTGHDFSRYKKGTFFRRIRRRAQLLRLATAKEYVEVLARDAQEPELLVKDLLIGVTQFFRDPEAFEFLAQHVIPRIVVGKGAGEAMRIWVPGCASGEEAYSLGILVREQIGAVNPAPAVQIFATDLDAEALAEARQGRYSADVVGQISPERLARFFTREGQQYQAVKELREMCVFSQHSLIRDPPFSALDLVSCRNVLIYLEADLQKKLVPVFHYALKPGGYLFLGPSEGLAGHPELFEAVEKQHHVFRRIEPVNRPTVDFPLTGRVAVRVAPVPPRVEAPAPTQQQALCTTFERLMLQEYSSPGVVVNARGDVLCVVGPTGRYFQQAVGAPSTNILDIAHTSLRIELRTALHAAMTTNRRVVRDDVQVYVEEAPRRLRLIVRPLPVVRQEANLYAIVLQERAPSPEAAAAEIGMEPTPGEQPAMEQLESELRTTRADLAATVEEMESSNEELRSSNEELISTNEELQSANEELQTSQEELSSVNEELETVNTELQRKVEELARANGDLQNLFAATEIATIFLDRELRVTKFTPAARTVFRLIEGDVGRPISDLAPRLAGLDLVADVNEVLRTLTPVERQIEALDRQAWFMLRILPYRTVENVIAGAVVTLVDITKAEHAEADLRRLATVLKDSNDALTVQDFDGRILAWNRGAERMFGYSEAEALKMNIEDLVPEEARGQERGFLEATRRGEEIASLEVKRRSKDGRTLDVWLTTTKLVDHQRRPVAVATTKRDITERKRAESRLAYLASFPELNPNPIVEADLEGRVRYANPAAQRLFPDLHEKGTAHPWIAGWETAARSVREGSADASVRTVTVGERSYQQTLYQAAEEGVVRAYGMDFTERKNAQERLQREQSLLASIMHSTDVMLVYLDRDFNFVWVNEAYAKTCHYRPEEMVGRNHFVLYPHAENEAIFRRVRDTGEPVFYKDKPFEFPDQPERGVTYWDWSLTPVKDASGQVQGLVFSLRETTKYKQAELRLRESEEKFAVIHDRSPVAISLTKMPEGTLVSVNDAFLSMFEFSREEVLGKTGADLGISDPDSTKGVFALLRERGSVRKLEVERRTKSGRPLVLSINIEQVVISGQELVLTAIEDITERKRAEEALRESEAALKDADRRKNEFLAMLSHELRNPLAPVRNSLYVLEHAAPGGEQAKRAHAIIDRQVGHMARLIDDLLDVTRITRGKIQLQRDLLDLKELTRRAVEDHRSLFAGNGVQLEMRPAPVEVWVSGDRIRLAQALGNLLQNAAKFTPRGGSTTVSAEADAARQEAILRVQDTGTGIAPQILPRLFEPFTQSDTTLDRSKGGLGLGLALVKGLVELHGGTVRGDSDGPEKGSTFTITLPLTAAPKATGPVQRESRGDGVAARRVLIIEDNVDAADSLREALALGEHIVEVAHSGPEGIEKARAFKPDVVLCDIGLPQMDGYAVARAMRADPILGHVSLVALTGYAQPEDIVRAKESGFDSHLPKPPSIEAIERVLDEIQSGNSRAQAGRVKISDR